jgi:hypothetical protein
VALVSSISFVNDCMSFTNHVARRDFIVWATVGAWIVTSLPFMVSTLWFPLAGPATRP